MDGNERNWELEGWNEKLESNLRSMMAKINDLQGEIKIKNAEI